MEFFSEVSISSLRGLLLVDIRIQLWHEGADFDLTCCDVYVHEIMYNCEIAKGKPGLVLSNNV
jgi:hypothetical protein